MPSPWPRQAHQSGCTKDIAQQMLSSSLQREIVSGEPDREVVHDSQKRDSPPPPLIVRHGVTPVLWMVPDDKEVHDLSLVIQKPEPHLVAFASV